METGPAGGRWREVFIVSTLKSASGGHGRRPRRRASPVGEAADV